jgi:4'-phosphopantetheinyl transferase
VALNSGQSYLAISSRAALSLAAGVELPASAAGQSLLTGMLQHLLGWHYLPEIVRGTMGKPVFEQPGLPSFSISHNASHVVVYLSHSGPVGCDLETLRPRPHWQALAQAWFSPAELKWLLSGNETEGLQRFWYCWTAREAWIKQQGLSVWDMAHMQLDVTQTPLRVVAASEMLLHLHLQQQLVCLCHPAGFERLLGCQALGQGVLLSYQHATGVV